MEDLVLFLISAIIVIVIFAPEHIRNFVYRVAGCNSIKLFQWNHVDNEGNQCEHTAFECQRCGHKKIGFWKIEVKK